MYKKSNKEEALQRASSDLRNRSIPGTLANAILWPAIFLPFDYHLQHPTLAWSCAAVMMLISLLRLVLFFSYTALENYKPYLWFSLFVACSLSQAAIWGGLFAQIIHLHAQEPIAVALILVIAGISSAAIPALSTVKSFAIANLAILLTPAIITCFYYQQSSLGTLIIVFWLTMSGICLVTTKQFRIAFETGLRLKESQRQMDLLANSINGVLWEYDIAAEKFNYVNRKVETILGYSPEQWMETDFLSLVHEEDKDALEQITSPKNPDNDSVDVVCRLRKASGDYAWVRNIITLDFVGDTAIVARGVFFDITEAKQAAVEHKSLQMQVQQGQKLEAIGQLAAGVAHEINTPIQFIGDNINFVSDSCKELCSYIDQCDKLVQLAHERQLDTALTQSIIDAADNISVDYLREEIPVALADAKEGTDRVAKIVSAMKEFSYPGSKEAQRIDISRAISSTIIMSKNEWKHHATVEFTPNEEIPLVECYAGELNQVFLNMIVNAAHAIEARPNKDDAGLITVATQLVDNSVEISITDNGSGMPPEVADRIFEPFYTTKEVGKGTGQGLSIAYAIVVEQHGGQIQVNSTEGEGTIFTLTIPINRDLSDVA